ncbi:MAG TPA: hypothetical protein VMF51_17785 [Nocardioides sp.]|uniref:hypothetical protein n=1 Tax=Nocardioides sp. TaxID=35761 RepID=UPI002C8F4BB7|nr:hypothetical protein [Nocardioides sp.]HTW16986.1 hypothetical protein [Nocardioides sp.]
MRSLRALAAASALLLAVTACSSGGDPQSQDPPAAPADTTGVAGEPAAETPAAAGSHAAHAAPKPGRVKPLRAGERRRTLTMPAAYTPSAPTGVGTDDYRCFLLDPQLKRDSWLTGTNVLPGNPDVVHHVILFRVPPEDVAKAEAKDAETPDDQGWTCFGGTALEGEFAQLDDAPWLGAWAPGGDEVVTRDGYGTDLPKGSRIIMQVHYNLLAGTAPDVSATQIRTMPRSRDLTALHTFLMPAPVELPCRPAHADGPLCERDAAVADAKSRFGQGPGSTADLLYFLCGGKPVASKRTSCVRRVQEPVTILGAAGHMHLLGRKLRIETNPGTPEERTILDIPMWDFDDQGSRPIDPVRLDTWDTVRITCTHSQELRDRLPAFATQRDDKYVVWADGTTDEMCLGMLSVAFG